MGTSLNGLTPAVTYPGLIKTGDNAPIDGTLKTLSDGNGNNLPMAVSTTTVNFTGTLTQGGTTLQPTLVSGTNIKTINGASLLGSGNIPVVTSPSGVSGAIQFSNGSAFASDAANLFYDDPNNRLGVGTNAPSATTHIKGSGSTSATTSLLVQNSAGTDALKVQDDLSSAVFGRTQFCVGFSAIPNNNEALRMLVLSSGKSYIDGFSEGASKAQNYAIIFGARANNTGNGISGNTTQENGSQVIFGFESIPASAQVAVNSTTRGFLPPRMTTAEKNAIVTPAAGLVVYDSTTNKLCCYNGTTWNDLF